MLLFRACWGRGFIFVFGERDFPRESSVRKKECELTNEILLQRALMKSLVNGMPIFLFGKRTWLLGRSPIIFMRIRLPRRTAVRTLRGKLSSQGANARAIASMQLPPAAPDGRPNSVKISSRHFAVFCGLRWRHQIRHFFYAR